MSPRSTVTTLAILLIVCSLGEGNAHQRKVEKQIIDNIFSSTNYDPRIRPSGVNSSFASIKPLDVLVDLYVIKIQRVDDDRRLYGIDTYFRQKWVDERLKYSQNSINYITLDDDEEIWTPDLFFNDFKATSHDVTKSNTFVRIYPNGTILYSRRYNLLLYCDMDFHEFPFDRQTCEMSIESYAWSGLDIKLQWLYPKDDSTTISKSPINEGLYTLTKHWKTAGTIKVSTGEYSFLKFFFVFQRDTNYYVLQIFIPCAMYTIVAYLTFWIQMKHFNARLILVLGTLLTMSMEISGVNMEVPKVSYTKSLDIYTGVSLTFVFVVLVETIIVYSVVSTDNDGRIDEGKSVKIIRDTNRSKLNEIRNWLLKSSDNKVDATLKFAFPLLYALFQIIFWTVCQS